MHNIFAPEKYQHWEKPNNFQQLSILLEIIENLALAGRSQRLRFHNARGQVVGSLVLDSGSIQFGVELAGQPYIDPIFASEALPYSASLIKHLHGAQLTSGESLLLTQLPLRVRRAIRALTARAMRELALVCQLSVHSVQSDVAADSSRGSLRVVFAPSELMLAAGVSGAICFDDPAVIEFETPPLTPKERWLFVCPLEDPCHPWPVMTRLLSALRVSHVVEKGRFCEQLLGYLPLLIPAPIAPGPLAALLTLDSLLHYVIKTTSYVALMMYPVEQQRRLLVALGAMAQRGRVPVVQIGEEAAKSSQRPVDPLPLLSGHSPAEPQSAEPLCNEDPAPTNPSPGKDYSGDHIDIARDTNNPPARSAAFDSKTDPLLANHTNAFWEADPLDTERQHGAAEIMGNLAVVMFDTAQQSLQSWRPIVTADDVITQPMEEEMALNSNSIKEVLAKLESSVDGFIGAAIADSDSGMCLGWVGGGGVLNLELAAAGNTEVVRSKRKAMKSLNLRDEIEDILITLGKQYHLIRPLRGRANVFIYLALDRSRANLALARHTLSEHERDVGL